MTLEEIKELKVGDFIKYSEKELEQCVEIMKDLKTFDMQFNTSQDISDLEFYVNIQKKMNGFLLSLSTHYAKLKSKKDILERKRKEWKAKIIRFIVADSHKPNGEGEVNKISINQSEKIVDADPRYIHVVEMTDRLMSFINRVDAVFWHHNETLKMVHQSVGIARGEKNRPDTATGEND